jgi:hypothetical protein
MNNECGAVGEMKIGRGNNLHQCGFIKSSRIKNIELFIRGSFSKDGVNGRKGKGLLAKFEREINRRKGKVK